MPKPDKPPGQNPPPQTQPQPVGDDDARTLIERFTAWDEEPALTAGEVDDLLRLAHGERLWEPEAYVEAGTVRRDAANSGAFAVVLAGTTGTAEPDWSADLIIDGTAQWTYVAEPSWDIYGVAGIGWDWKAAKVAGRYDLSRSAQSWQRSQQWQHCVKMAEYYRGLGSGRVAGGRTQGGAGGAGRPGLITVASPTFAYPVIAGIGTAPMVDAFTEPPLEMADE